MGTTTTKRDQLIEAAGRLFCSEGFHATGIDRIVEEAGVAKMTLYKHFRSKDELILATLRRKDEQWRRWLVDRVEELASSPAEQVLAVFDAMHEWLSSDGFAGCLFARAGGEYGCEQSPIRRAASEHNRLVEEYVQGLLREAGAPDPAGLAAEIGVLMEGAIARTQCDCDADAAAVARRACERLLCCAGVREAPAPGAG